MLLAVFYTLNIDDAIETNSDFRNKILPNRAIADSAKTFPCVYKVHGDASDELLYDEPSKIIFSTGAYLRSLTTNRSMLTALKTDLIEQNTLFVGCSLNNELDVLYALAEYHGQFPEGRRSIYVTTSEINRFDQAKLSAHGINSILRVADYHAFYRAMASWGTSSPAPVFSAPLQLSDSSLKRLAPDRLLNLSFLSQVPIQDRAGEMTIPAYHIRRDIEDAMLRISADLPLVLLRGRRFSGRTLLLRSLAYSSRARTVYLATSETQVTEEVLMELLQCQNSLLLFDSNSLTTAAAVLLARRVETLKNNRSSAIVAINRTEPDILGTLIRYVEDRADFELDSRFSIGEIERLNANLDALGLLKFDRRRTILDNTYRILEHSPNKASALEMEPNLDQKEVELLLIIAIADKAFSNLATALDIRAEELYSLCNRLAPILDLHETDKSELRVTNSRYKVITNSATGLGIQIRALNENVKESAY